jgi:signal transduction histidine kinase
LQLFLTAKSGIVVYPASDRVAEPSDQPESLDSWMNLLSAGSLLFDVQIQLTPMSPVSTPLSAKASRILVVDDSPNNRLLIQGVLEQEGYEVHLAGEGRAALAHIDLSPPDLVLLDTLMPDIDGYEVTQRIRQNLRLPFIPILLMAAYNQSDIFQGLELGADDCLRKPVEVNELLIRVRSLIRLKRSMDERDRIAQQREDFVARLTHDLRIPLVAAGRMLTLFQDGVLGELPPAMLDAIATMERSNQNLLQMVNNLLEVHRYEASRKTLSFTQIDLKELIQEVAQELMPLIQERKLILSLELDQSSDDPQPESGVIMGDRLELHRVLMNLLGNAIKFTQEGAITCRLKLTQNPSKSDSTLAPWLRLEIEDTGIGIDPSEQAQIFERFRQGSAYHLGSGLGLYLVRLIVEAHRGNIEVYSEVGKGSTFSVNLPLHQQR